MSEPDGGDGDATAGGGVAADSLSRLPCIQCGRDSHNAVSEIAATALQGPLIQPSDELRNQSWPTGRSVQSSGERRRVKSLM